MASTYSCGRCGTNLNLSTHHLFPPDFYFESGNKGSLSFSFIDDSKFSFVEENKLMPFFETVDYWGIQRKRIKIKCGSCGYSLGYIYDDGPPMTTTSGVMHMGPSQVIPRKSRYRFKLKAIKMT